MRKSKRKQKKGYRGGVEPTLQQYYIPFKRKSIAGIEYTFFRKIVDKIILENE